MLGEAGNPGNTGADDVRGTISIGGGPALPGIEARFKARDATAAAIGYFGTAQGAIYGYADPNPPTFNTVSASAVRDVSAGGLVAARDSLTKSDQVWCPLVGASPECARSCTPGQGADLDCDGIPNTSDNCPYWPTANQADTNGDGRGDACQCGDANADGFVDINDILAANTAIFVPSQTGGLCDANGDGTCNINDILSINEAIFGVSTPICSRHPVL